MTPAHFTPERIEKLRKHFKDLAWSQWHNPVELCPKCTDLLAILDQYAAPEPTTEERKKIRAKSIEWVKNYMPAASLLTEDILSALSAPERKKVMPNDAKITRKERAEILERCGGDWCHCPLGESDEDKDIAIGEEPKP